MIGLACGFSSLSTPWCFDMHPKAGETVAFRHDGQLIPATEQLT